jgi:hypothetical protein
MQSCLTVKCTVDLWFPKLALIFFNTYLERLGNSLTLASQFSCFLTCSRASFHVIFAFLPLGTINQPISYSARCVLYVSNPWALPAGAFLSERVREESTRVNSEDIASGLAAKGEVFFESLRGMVDWLCESLELGNWSSSEVCDFRRSIMTVKS